MNAFTTDSKTYSVVCRNHDMGSKNVTIKRTGKGRAFQTVDLMKQCGYSEVIVKGESGKVVLDKDGVIPSGTLTE